MVALRKVYGPFKMTINQRMGEVYWYFNAIRADKTMAHYKLTYSAEIRAFRGNSIPLKRRTKDSVEQPDMFMGSDRSKDPPIEEGPLHEILRRHLNPEDIAECNRLALIRERS